jgi:hypothetical protein
MMMRRPEFLMMRRPEFLMMRRPEFLMMRRPCAALRCPALPCAALRRPENPDRSAPTILLAILHIIMYNNISTVYMFGKLNLLLKVMFLRNFSILKLFFI